MFQHLLSPLRGRWWPALAGVAGVMSVGYFIVAIGTPLGWQGGDTEGTGSTHGRSVNEDFGFALPNEIQSSSAVSPGTSGGLLFDLSGQAIGSPPLAATDPQVDGGKAAGVGFAIQGNQGTTSRPGSSISEGSPPPSAPTWTSRPQPPPAADRW